MASGSIKKDGSISFKVEEFAIPSTKIAGGSYVEISNIDVSQTGWEPISLIRVYPNRSNAVLCGFNLSKPANTVRIMLKNVSQNAVVVDSGTIAVLYAQV
jgi:hypothetical protein